MAIMRNITAMTRKETLVFEEAFNSAACIREKFQRQMMQTEMGFLNENKTESEKLQSMKSQQLLIYGDLITFLNA